MKTRPNIPKIETSDEDERLRKREAIARGRADVTAGRVVDHDEVRRWV
jgi:predicted transcriptional regulator